MGYIKKLKNNELVGGTDKHTIYPVTSTEAVFEEITEGNKSSFKSQKTINKEHQDILDDHEDRIQEAEVNDVKSITINGSTKKFVVDDENNVDLTVYTVDDDPEMPDIADKVDELRNMVGTSTPVLETSHKTRIETLEGGDSVTGSVENKIKTKVDSINSSYQDDDNEYVKYSMTQTSGEVTNFNIDETSLKNAITSLNSSISGDNIVIRSGSTPSGTGEPGKIYRYINSSANTYTDYMYSGGSWVALATHDTSNEQAQVAYYTCTATGSGAQATKQFISNGSLTYNPSSGGHIKILMGEANTATGTIYLQFGTTASTKKPLYYNGEPVSPGNTWEAEETIAVYYDPSANSNTGAYFASNAQGGGGKAEKIKYDNSQSGFAADNVQVALDEINNNTITFFEKYENLKGNICWGNKNIYNGNIVDHAKNRLFVFTAHGEKVRFKKTDSLIHGVVYKYTGTTYSRVHDDTVFDMVFPVSSAVDGKFAFLLYKGTDTISDDIVEAQDIVITSFTEESVSAGDGNIYSVSSKISLLERNFQKLQEKLNPIAENLENVEIAFDGSTSNIKHAFFNIPFGTTVRVTFPTMPQAVQTSQASNGFDVWVDGKSELQISQNKIVSDLKPSYTFIVNSNLLIYERLVGSCVISFENNLINSLEEDIQELKSDISNLSNNKISVFDSYLLARKDSDNFLIVPPYSFLAREKGNIFWLKCETRAILNPVTNFDFADPTIIKIGNYFYAARTGFPMAIYRSKDLANWEFYRNIFSGSSSADPFGDGSTDPMGMGTTSLQMWAPCLFMYNNKIYVYVYTIDWTGNHNRRATNILVADDIDSPFSRVGILIDNFSNTSTTEGDVQIFFDTDGSKYICMGDTSPLKIQQLTDDCLSVVGNRVTIASGSIQGPYLFKRNDIYYVFYSLGTSTSWTYTVTYRTSHNIFSGWSDQKTILVAKDSSQKLNSTGGVAGIIEDIDGRYYMLMHCHAYGLTDGDDTGYGKRYLYIQELVFNDNGSVNFVDINRDINTEPQWITTCPNV